MNDHPKDWRELCKLAAQEADPEKLMDLILELNRALDEREKKRKPNLDDTREKNCCEKSLRSAPSAP